MESLTNVVNSISNFLSGDTEKRDSIEQFKRDLDEKYDYITTINNYLRNFDIKNARDTLEECKCKNKFDMTEIVEGISVHNLTVEIVELLLEYTNDKAKTATSNITSILSFLSINNLEDPNTKEQRVEYFIKLLKLGAIVRNHTIEHLVRLNNLMLLKYVYENKYFINMNYDHDKLLYIANHNMSKIIEDKVYTDEELSALKQHNTETQMMIDYLKLIGLKDDEAKKNELVNVIITYLVLKSHKDNKYKREDMWTAVTELLKSGFNLDYDDCRLIECSLMYDELELFVLFLNNGFDIKKYDHETEDKLMLYHHYKKIPELKNVLQKHHFEFKNMRWQW